MGGIRAERLASAMLPPGSCGCEYSCHKTGPADPIDADFKDENCDGSDGVMEKCIFVANDGRLTVSSRPAAV